VELVSVVDVDVVEVGLVVEVWVVLEEPVVVEEVPASGLGSPLPSADPTCPLDGAVT
jgi:hypothetical protein